MQLGWGGWVSKGTHRSALSYGFKECVYHNCALLCPHPHDAIVCSIRLRPCNRPLVRRPLVPCWLPGAATVCAVVVEALREVGGMLGMNNGLAWSRPSAR